MPEHDTFFIGGDWTAARGTAIITIVNPSTGEIVGRVRTGTIGVSRYLPDTAAPFGGSKASGNGRDLGPEALAAHLEIKSIDV